MTSQMQKALAITLPASTVIPLKPISKSNRFEKEYASHVFDNIDTEEKAYWLGFLYADGCVSSLGNALTLSLKESDLEHVKRFRSFMHLDGKEIKKRIKELNNNEYVGYTFSFCNKNLKKELVKKGCIPRKTFLLTFPTEQIVPKNLTKHFVRGYLDGDGSITHGGVGSSKITIEMLGTQIFLAGYLKWANCSRKIYSFKHPSIKHSIIGGASAIYILDNLYQDASIYLQRKYDTYLKLRRLAMMSPRTARELVGKIGEGRTLMKAS